VLEQDLHELEMLKDAKAEGIICLTKKEEKEKEYAQTIYPLRKHGNKILFTIVFANSAVNVAIAVMMV